MERIKSLQIWSLINLGILTAVIVINVLASTLPLNGLDTGQLSDMYPNLFVPAGLTFSIWGVIYLLLISFALFGLYTAFTSRESAKPLEKIGSWFLISSLVNIGWIFSWHWKMPILSLVFMLVILFSLIRIYLAQHQNVVPTSTKEKLFFTAPFSVYLGWITVATIANVTTVLVDLGWSGGPFSETFWTAFVIIAAVVITGIVLFIQGDLLYAAVIVWSLLGIIIKRSNVGDAPIVVAVASIGLVLIIIYAILRKTVMTR